MARKRPSLKDYLTTGKVFVEEVEAASIPSGPSVAETAPGEPSAGTTAVVAEQETAHLVGSAETILDRPHHTQHRVAVTLEVQHHVDEMLQ